MVFSVTYYLKSCTAITFYSSYQFSLAKIKYVVWTLLEIMFPVNSNSIAKLRIVNDTQYHKRCTSVYLVLAVPAMIFQALSHVLGN